MTITLTATIMSLLFPCMNDRMSSDIRRAQFYESSQSRSKSLITEDTCYGSTNKLLLTLNNICVLQSKNYVKVSVRK